MKKEVMTQLELYCAAKVNLSLDVTGKLPNGYHTLESIFQTVNIYDEITLFRDDVFQNPPPPLPYITMECNKKRIPCDETNLAWKAAAAIMEVSGKQAGIHIKLKKYIPSGAGMGGGSSDAAAVLYGLNKMLDCGFSTEELCEIGAKLGADVPFFLIGGTAYVEGIGERITPLPPLPKFSMLIVKGRKGISTPEAYKAIDLLESPEHPDTAAMLRAVETQDIDLLCESCGNLFEQVTTLEEVHRAKQRILECGARCAVMTGSGAAVFGILDKPIPQATVKELKKEFGFADTCSIVAEPFIEVYSNTSIMNGGSE